MARKLGTIEITFKVNIPFWDTVKLYFMGKNARKKIIDVFIKEMEKSFTKVREENQARKN